MSPQPRKRFAQHWLRSENVLNQIIQAAQLKNTDRLLEIGPGTGILTRRLLEGVDSVLAVEIDQDLCQKLVKSFGDRENFLLLQGDFLTLDIETQLTSFPRFQKQNKVVANIPYNITGPILEKLLGSITYPCPKHYEQIVLLVQKEVADRLVAKPKTKAYGSLSVKIQYIADCELICHVPAAAFHPRPQVDSAVVRLSPRAYPNPPENLQFLETLLKLGFAARRKMLKNNLKSLIDSDSLSQLLEKLSINPQARGEELSLREWIALSNHLQPQP